MPNLTDILRAVSTMAYGGPPTPTTFRYDFGNGELPQYLAGGFGSNGKWTSDEELQRRAARSMEGRGQGRFKLGEYGQVGSASGPPLPSRFPTDEEQYESWERNRTEERRKAEEKRRQANSYGEPDISMIPRPGLMLAMAALASLGNNPYRPDDNPFKSFMDGYAGGAMDRYRRAKAKLDQQAQRDRDEADEHDKNAEDLLQRINEMIFRRGTSPIVAQPEDFPEESEPGPVRTGVDKDGVRNSRNYFLNALDPEGSWRTPEVGPPRSELGQASEISKRWADVHLSKERLAKAIGTLRAQGDPASRAEAIAAKAAYDNAHRQWMSEPNQAVHAKLLASLQAGLVAAKKQLAAAKTPVEREKAKAKLLSARRQVQYLTMAISQANDRSAVEKLLMPE